MSAHPFARRTKARDLLAGLREAIPSDLRDSAPAGPDRLTVTAERIQRRFLAGHAFASWTAYLGHDLRAWGASIDAAHAGPGGAVRPFEDFLHSVTATGMGFAFAFGVLIRVVGRRPGQAARRAFDLVAIAAATLLPASSLPWPSVAGLTQQAMFVIAYVWYAGEALLIGRNAAAVKASG